MTEGGLLITPVNSQMVTRTLSTGKFKGKFGLLY